MSKCLESDPEKVVTQNLQVRERERERERERNMSKSEDKKMRGIIYGSAKRIL